MISNKTSAYYYAGRNFSRGLISSAEYLSESITSNQISVISSFLKSFPPFITRAKIPSRGIIQSPVAFFMAQPLLWHSLPIW